MSVEYVALRMQDKYSACAEIQVDGQFHGLVYARSSAVNWVPFGTEFPFCKFSWMFTPRILGSTVLQIDVHHSELDMVIQELATQLPPF